MCLDLHQAWTKGSFKPAKITLHPTHKPSQQFTATCFIDSLIGSEGTKQAYKAADVSTKKKKCEICFQVQPLWRLTSVADSFSVSIGNSTNMQTLFPSCWVLQTLNSWGSTNTHCSTAAPSPCTSIPISFTTFAAPVTEAAWTRSQ